MLSSGRTVSPMQMPHPVLGRKGWAFSSNALPHIIRLLHFVKSNYWLVSIQIIHEITKVKSKEALGPMPGLLQVPDLLRWEGTSLFNAPSLPHLMFWFHKYFVTIVLLVGAGDEEWRQVEGASQVEPRHCCRQTTATKAARPTFISSHGLTFVNFFQIITKGDLF